MSEDTVPYYHKPEPIIDPALGDVFRMLLLESGVIERAFDNPTELRDGLEKALQSCIKQAVYLRRAILELDKETDDGR